jgi:hypothetical protein
MAKRYYEAKKMMKKAGGMISEDHSAPCLLPQHVIEKDFGSVASAMGGQIDDLYMGVQKQHAEDTSDLKKAMKPSKY